MGTRIATHASIVTTYRDKKWLQNARRRATEDQFNGKNSFHSLL